MTKIQVLPNKTCVMIAAYILDLVQASNHDQGKCITLELYFTFKLSASEDTVFQLEFSFMFNLVISGYT